MAAAMLTGDRYGMTFFTSLKFRRIAAGVVVHLAVVVMLLALFNFCLGSMYLGLLAFAVGVVGLVEDPYRRIAHEFPYWPTIGVIALGFAVPGL